MSAKDLQRLIDEARRAVEADDDHWARLATGQDTEEAEESGRLVGYLEGVKAAMELTATQHVHVVEIFEREDGNYVFADLDDAVAFEEAVNDDAASPRCFRREEVVCDHADTLKLIESEEED